MCIVILYTHVKRTLFLSYQAISSLRSMNEMWTSFFAGHRVVAAEMVASETHVIATQAAGGDVTSSKQANSHSSSPVQRHHFFLSKPQTLSKIFALLFFLYPVQVTVTGSALADSSQPTNPASISVLWFCQTTSFFLAVRAFSDSSMRSQLHLFLWSKSCIALV